MKVLIAGASGAIGRPPVSRPVEAALRPVEDAVTGITWADGIVLRYGCFHGPGAGAQRRAGRGHDRADPQVSRGAMSTSDPYVELRSRAFAIAYQMLGSVGEAEDVMQEAFLRLHRAQREGGTIASPRAYIATLVTRLSIDQLRSARVRREQYVGEWLPEPLAADPSPGEHAETADSLSLAVLVLLETLTPQQRAAFLLREVFEYPYSDVAEIIGTDVDTTRHLVARARRHVRERRPRYRTTRQEQRRLAGRFFAAVQDGDLPALEELLAQDVAMHGDGGGRVPALGRPLDGRRPVARVLAAMAPMLARAGGVRFRLTTVNGQPGALVFDARDLLVAVMGLDIADGHIQAIHSVVNPDKLQHFGRVGNLGDLVHTNTERTDNNG